MDDDIVRKLKSRRTFPPGQLNESPRSRHRKSLRSQTIAFLNIDQLKNDFIRPYRESTPQRGKRKPADNPDSERRLSRKTRGTLDNVLIQDITPIKNDNSGIKNGHIISKSFTFPRKTDKTLSKAHSSKNLAKVCGDSFDNKLSKSPIQSRMLSLDESLLEMVDLDIAIKDYWSNKNKTVNADSGIADCEERLGTTDLSALSDSEIVNDVKKLAEQECEGTIKSKNSVQCTSKSTVVSDIVSDIVTENFSSEEKAVDSSRVDIHWDNDSMIEAAICDLDDAIPLSGTLRSSNIPLGEKIKLALINNVQKPVVPKPKVVQVNVVCDTSANFGVGPFFGLPVKVKALMEKYKGINSLYKWQEECLNMCALQERKNLVYALPTSGGKTLVAEILILRELICHRKNVVFVLPFVAIVQEKVRSLAPFGLELDFFVEEYAAGKGQYPPRKRRRKQTVYVATIEKALGLVNSLIEVGRLEELGLLVVDEIHLVGESNGRGSTLEGLLTKLLYLDANIQIVGMSATIGNLCEVATFLKAETYTKNFRPVELKEYVKCDDCLYAINYNTPCSDEMLVLERRLSYSYATNSVCVDPDLIGGLVMEVIPDNSCLVFCPTKKNCENVAQLICSVLPGELLQHKQEEKKALYRALLSEGNGSICSVLKKTLPFGMAYHHSGLTADEKRLLQEAYLTGTLCCLCCTSTLAAGVNLPAKRVILRSPYIGISFINLSRYKQMVGRAGRAGFGEAGESILICKKSDAPKVKEMLSSTMDEVVSSLHMDDARGIRSLVLSCVGLGIATTRSALRKLMDCSLLSIQASRLGVDLHFLIDEAIIALIRLEALKTVTNENSSPDSSIVLDNSSNVSVHILDTSESPVRRNSSPSIDKKNKTARTVYLQNDTELRISKLGKAAIKGCVQLSLARTLHRDLVQAQSSLVVLSYIHLLYLVTPYDLMNQIKPNPTVYFSVYSKLGIRELQAAHVLGVTEGCMARMMNGHSVKPEQQRVLNRFYLTLMLFELWNQKSVWDVADKYQVARGFVQSLMTSAASFSSCVLRFCEEISEFWAFRDLLVNFSQQLSHCCSADLLPLMDLPAVKKGRARQLYKAGYRSLQAVANADPVVMVQSIDHMPKKVANQIIAAAKLLLKQKADNLREEAEDVLEGLES
ncbi:helicase POLQ-like [Periplaneta americana]|uniref:helicase POLQ-like n=1 Tax=Periplaneta americana TaxID=6978 RepID=UPI0037E8B632